MTKDAKVAVVPSSYPVNKVLELHEAQRLFSAVLDGEDVGEEKVHQFIVEHSNFMAPDQP